MHNLLEYSNNYSTKPGSLWNYYRDEINDDDNAADGKSFKYNTEVIGKAEARPAQSGNDGNADQSLRDSVIPLNTEITALLKFLGNFRRSRDLPLINCEMKLDLLQVKNCLL